mgnify:CR=1 FL=1
MSPDAQYLEKAKDLGNYLLDHFWDESQSSFFMTADNHEQLIIRPKSNYDLSMPSGNSVAAYLLLRLYHLTQEQKFLETATKVMKSQAMMAAENPFGFGYLLNTIYMYLQKPTEITILNSNNDAMTNYLFEEFLPESIIVAIANKSQLEKLSELMFFAGKEFPHDKTTVFICKDFSCSLPLEKIPDVEKLL